MLMVLRETCRILHRLEVGEEAIHMACRPFLFATRKASFRYGDRDNACCAILGKGAAQRQERDREMKDKAWNIMTRLNLVE
jgi:hypothetical protein